MQVNEVYKTYESHCQPEKMKHVWWGCLLFNFFFFPFFSPEIFAAGFEEGAAALEVVWKLRKARKHWLGRLEHGANNAEVVCSISRGPFT